MLRRALADPRTRGLDLDHPSTTGLRRQIIAGKPLLREVYGDWHERLAKATPPGTQPALEIGAGAATLGSIPRLIRSEVFWCPWLDLVADSQALPFAHGSLRAVTMVNVLHHVAEPERLLAEAARCVREGGVLAMIEPWVTAGSRVVYRHLHHEPFDPGADEWRAHGGGPLSRANGALPWIIFVRDREEFSRRFPQWILERVEPLLGMRYLVSGGVSIRSLSPVWSRGFWRTIDLGFSPLARWLGMFSLVVLRRQPSA